MEIDLRGKKILVTGGAGFIGSVTARRLMMAGAEVYAVDNNPIRGWPTFLANAWTQDYANSTLWDRLQRIEIDGIVHCAGTSLVGPSLKWPATYYENNVGKTIEMLSRISQFDNPPAVVFSSSAAVYGNPKATNLNPETFQPYSKDFLPITEHQRKDPINPYGRTKAMIEDILADYNTAYGLNSYSLRYFNACGASPHTGPLDDDTHLIPKMFQAHQANEPFKIFGSDYETADGTCIRDYIHVNDIASAHILALQNMFGGGTGAQVYNLGTKDGYSILQVISEFNLAMECNLEYEWHARREGDPDILTANGEKFQHKFGWKPKWSDMRTIMDTTKEFYEENK